MDDAVESKHFNGTCTRDGLRELPTTAHRRCQEAIGPGDFTLERRPRLAYRPCTAPFAFSAAIDDLSCSVCAVA
jgi:hypothetical protein